MSEQTGPAGGASEQDTSAPSPATDPGASTTDSGEDISSRDGKEAGRQDAAPQGGSDRPAGTSTSRDRSSVNPQDPIDPDSPNLQ